MALNFRFSVFNQTILDFVSDFYTRYGKFPALTTVSAEFPNAVLPQPTEPFDYWFTKLADARNKELLSQALERISTAANNNDLAAAVKELSTSSARFKGGFTSGSAVSLTDPSVIATSAEAFRENRDKVQIKGIPTGINALDELTNGLTEDDLMYLIARPRSFKTWLMLRMALEAAFSGVHAVFFTKEMRYPGIKRRLDALIAGDFPYNDVRLSKLTDEQIDFISSRWVELGKTGGNITILEPVTGEPFDLSFLNSQIIEHSPDIAFVDGAYLLAKSEEWKDQTALSRGLKDTNARFRIPVVASLQFSRKKTSRGRMDLDAAAYADAFSQDGSVILGLERKFDANSNRLTNRLRIETLKMRESDDNNTFGFNADLTSAARLTEVSITDEASHEADWSAGGATPDMPPAAPLLTPEELADIKF